jgi:hypothetical protein
VQWISVRQKERHVLTEETFDNIGARLTASLKKTLCLLALQCGMSTSILHAVTKLLKLWPYEMKVVHSLLPPDCEARI